MSVTQKHIIAFSAICRAAVLSAVTDRSVRCWWTFSFLLLIVGMRVRSGSVPRRVPQRTCCVSETLSESALLRGGCGLYRARQEPALTS